MADPSYAVAHAHLAFAYAWTAIFIEDAPQLIDEAKRKLAAAEAIEDLALIHLARRFLLYSRYEGWRIKDSLSELKRAKTLDPQLSDNEYPQPSDSGCLPGCDDTRTRLHVCDDGR